MAIVLASVKPRNNQSRLAVSVGNNGIPMNFSTISYQSKLGKLLRSPLRLIPPTSVMPIIQGPLRGSKWIAGAGNHGCWLGSYEQQKGAAISKAISPGDVFYDIGANAGYYTLLGSRTTGKIGHVYSFEPLPLNLNFLRKHIQINSIENSSVLELAVTAADGVSSFTIGDNSCVGHLTSQSGDNTIRVRTASLDSLVTSKAIRPPRVIKCDIEGGEYDALRGATEVLTHYMPVLFLATHGQDVHTKCIQLLRDIDFEVRDLDGGHEGTTDELIAVSRNLTSPTRAPSPE